MWPLLPVAADAYLCVQYKSLLAIVEYMASLPYSARFKDFIFTYRKILQPRSLYTSVPEVIMTQNCFILLSVSCAM